MNYDDEITLLPNLQDMAQYPIERGEFSRIFDFLWEKFWDIIPFEDDEFRVWKYEDERYILHKRSGTLINWYKNLGRCNTCSKKLTIEEYEQFAELLKESLGDK